MDIPPEQNATPISVDILAVGPRDEIPHTHGRRRIGSYFAYL